MKVNDEKTKMISSIDGECKRYSGKLSIAVCRRGVLAEFQ